jgi:hypothetical protein
MINMKKKITIFAMLIFCYVKNSVAQEQGVSDILVQDGKINAVIVVASILLTGLFVLLFVIERRVKKLEK